MVEQDPCPVDDDKLLTTNQPLAFIMLVPELNTTHTKSSTCFFSSPPLPSSPLLHMSAPGRASRTHIGPVRGLGHKGSMDCPFNTTQSQISLPFSGQLLCESCMRVCVIILAAHPVPGEASPWPHCHTGANNR